VSDPQISAPQYRVVRPVGRWAGQPVALNSATAGRRIGFVWDHVFRGDELFAVIEYALMERDRGLTFVGYEAFGDIHGRDAAEVVAALPSRLRAEEVDAVIVGVGA
jgi:hypothetical protein